MNIRRVIKLGILGISSAVACMTCAAAEQKDSVEVFAYITAPGKGGLRLATLTDADIWSPLGPGEGLELLKSDFGPWGGDMKAIFEPRLFRTPDGWRAVWYVTERRQTVACADSHDLISWRPQRYVSVKESGQFFTPYMKEAVRDTVSVNGKKYEGGRFRISRAHINRLLSHLYAQEAKWEEHSERLSGDSSIPAMSLPVKVTAARSSRNPVSMSPNLFGVFFEDINYGADGGLYAELVQNRDFEYGPGERRGGDWDSTYAWTLTDGKRVEPLRIMQESPLHANNPHYLRVCGGKNGKTLANSGFDGISLRKGEKYDFSLFSRLNGVGNAVITVQVVKDGKVYASGKVRISGDVWNKTETALTSRDDVSGASLQIGIPKSVECDLDMISLFPQDTYKGRKNGLRRDLAETIAALHPRFVRFPGGCVAHGNDVDNIYDWKGSIGPLESRRPKYNLWGYHQTRGLGYDEYFRFCEDLDAEPLPVLAAGVPCQNSGRTWSGAVNELTTYGQQEGVPMDKMPEYIQDVLDLIEYANGDLSTEWGARRAANGHPESYNLKFVGIGNEDLMSEVFEERFRAIYDAVSKKYPEIKVVGSAGPFCEGSDYERGWEIARELEIPLVDEHYYVSPGWLMNNRHFYDRYPRGGSKVYLGEYASHVPGRRNNMETALSTALYLTDVERNGEVVEMASYAPLLAKNGHTQWRPDLIYFDNDSVYPTTDYYVQRMFGNNQGDTYLPSDLTFETLNPDASRRFGYSAMGDSESGDIIVKIVNVLPVEVSLDLPYGGDAEVTVLAGDPEQENAVPRTSQMTVDDYLLIPPYSLSVYRFRR